MSSLETTSTSITRLKLSKATRASSKKMTWNDKYLDYEIETLNGVIGHISGVNLKRQVPRLRDWNAAGNCTSGRYFGTWNDKYLDYEIETVARSGGVRSRQQTWNDKYLDYEIETLLKPFVTLNALNLKRQVPRLRDWNSKRNTVSNPGLLLLVVSRLRRDAHRARYCIVSIS